MGAWAKSDPFKVQMSAVSYAVYDLLAQSVRRQQRLLEARSGITTVWYSGTEY